MRRAAAFVAWMAAVLGGADAAAQVRVDLELVLLADASGSIDDGEIRFQRQGYAAAITDREVLAAISGGFQGRIALTYVEWGDASSQVVVVPWTVIDGAQAAAGFARDLLAAPRLAAGRNAIGSAIAAGQALIADPAIVGTRNVIDISADSANSWGGVPLAAARAAALAAGITINGLAVLCRQCSGPPVGYDLDEAFARTIIGGPGAFVVSADSSTQFAEAVRRKLLLEIAADTDAQGPATRPSEIRLSAAE